MYWSERVAWTATNALWADLAAHLVRLDLGFHKTHTPGELIERVDGDVNALAGFFSSLVVQLADSALLLGGVLVAVYLVALRLGLAFMAFALAALALLGWVRRFGTPHWQEDRAQSAAFYGYVGEVRRAANSSSIRARLLRVRGRGAHGQRRHPLERRGAVRAAAFPGAPARMVAGQAPGGAVEAGGDDGRHRRLCCRRCHRLWAGRRPVPAARHPPGHGVHGRRLHGDAGRAHRDDSPSAPGPATGGCGHGACARAAGDPIAAAGRRWYLACRRPGHRVPCGALCLWEWAESCGQPARGAGDRARGHLLPARGRAGAGALGAHGQRQDDHRPAALPPVRSAGGRGAPGRHRPAARKARELAGTGGPGDAGRAALRGDAARQYHFLRPLYLRQ